MNASIKRAVYGSAFAVAFGGVLAALTAHPSTQMARAQGRAITGSVVSSKGPEAGVWVIAETRELPRNFAKIVVTDDKGQFVLPDLPAATYDVWVRGYGLVDSMPVKVRPAGSSVSLKAIVAKTPQEAAKVYPANYWLSMLNIPPTSEFPGTGGSGNGIPATMRSQAQWVNQVKQGCEGCHQLGNEYTRGVSHLKSMGLNSVEAWDYRIQVGQRGSGMSSGMNAFGRQRGLKMFADWTDRIAAGQVPAEAPPRPTGVERNVVLTMWDWGTDKSYLHDEIATSRANPRVNAYGPVYGVDNGLGRLIMIDPNENSMRTLQIPTRQEQLTITSRLPQRMLKPSPLMGTELLWTSEKGPADPHNPMFDTKGRVWLTSLIRNADNPAWCKEGSSNKFAQWFPLTHAERQASVYDPKTGKFTLIDTCFNTHHLVFGEDPNETLYFSTLGGAAVYPWIDTKKFDETHDEQASQGWCPIVLDTNGDGKITKPWNEPTGSGRGATEEQVETERITKFDATRDTRINNDAYGVTVNPVDHSAWGAVSSFPGRLIRMTKGDNPPATCMTEMYELPEDISSGFGGHGVDIDRNGRLWMVLSGSGGMASFDRSKCKVLNGPSIVNGQHCREGWTHYPLTVGPKFKGTDYNVDFHYYNWVDQLNTSGLGANLPVLMGSGSDSLHVLKPDTHQWITLRVPYPLGFYSRGADGRIDDPKAGWKGRGLWAEFGTNAIWHIEGGRGTTSKLVHFQIRPDPLAQ